LLSSLGTLYTSSKNRGLVRVTGENGLWVHKHPTANLVFRSIHAVSPNQLDAITENTFFYSYTPRLGDTVIDVGAGVGTETLTFSRLVGGTGKIIAIEAHPETYRCLARACHLNRLVNVAPLQLAIMNMSGEVKISDTETNISNTVMNDSVHGVTVPGIPLDELIDSENISEINFLKMNIEGAEAPAMEGMQRTLSITKNIVISCHDFIADAGGTETMRTKETVRKSLEAHDFSIKERMDDARPWVRDTLYGTRIF